MLRIAAQSALRPHPGRGVRRSITILQKGTVLRSEKLGAIPTTISTSLGPKTPCWFAAMNRTVQVSKFEGEQTIARVQLQDYKGIVSTPVLRGLPSFTEDDVVRVCALLAIPENNQNQDVKKWVLIAQHYTGMPTGQLEKGVRSGIVRAKTQYEGSDRGNIASFDLNTVSAQITATKTQGKEKENLELLFVPVDHPAIVKIHTMFETLKKVEPVSTLDESELAPLLRKYPLSRYEKAVLLKAEVTDRKNGVFCVQATDFTEECKELNRFFKRALPDDGSYCIRKTEETDSYEEPIFELRDNPIVPPYDDEFVLLEMD